MAQFDVYRNPDQHTCQTFPYLLDVQHNMLDILATRLVIPLIKKSRICQPIRDLNPELVVDNTSYYLSTPEMAGVSKKLLREPVTSLVANRSDILRAVDMLTTGI